MRRIFSQISLRENTMKKTNQLLGGLFCIFTLYFTGCTESRDQPISHGFFTRTKSAPWQEHSYQISIYLKHNNANILIWKSMAISFGGPVLLPGGGLLFCANDADKNRSLFVSDANGKVAEITPLFLNQRDLVGFYAIEDLTNSIRILGDTLNGTINAASLPEDVIKCAATVFQGGKTRSFNGVTYYY